ncbi:ATP-binding cassette domain-containing protein [Smaragdicoccus niigatensis]|uniref:ATP-binding cassette domain-containing protein n=1 Tax=Smaragdicoccus niigatensis TaxID=359359 RepID=UPI00037C7043|nr:ATP-binding cassette domain-containing protein [Smaragdicoccus niigatensis]
MRDVSFTVNSGDVLALIGGPGAGKTMLLHALMGLAPIESGAIEYAGDPTPGHGLPSLVGTVLSEPALHPSRTVRAHLQIIAAGYRDARTRINVVVAITGLSDALDRPGRDLDPSTTLRVALASALLPQPEVLLIDEPVFGPGVQLSAVAPIIAAYARNGGAVIIAGRGLAELSQIATHATVLRQGQQSLTATMPALLARLHGNLVVATPAQKQLALTLAAAGFTDVTIRRDGRLLVVGCPTSRLATLSQDAHILIQHVQSEFGSLDDIYSSSAGVPPIPWGFGAVSSPAPQPSWAGQR